MSRFRSVALRDRPAGSGRRRRTTWGVLSYRWQESPCGDHLFVHAMMVLDPSRSGWKRYNQRYARTVSYERLPHLRLLDQILTAAEQLAGREPVDLHQVLWEAAGDIGAAAALVRSLTEMLVEVGRREQLAVESERFDVSDVEREVAVRLTRIREENQASAEAVAWLEEHPGEIEVAPVGLPTPSLVSD